MDLILSSRCSPRNKMYFNLSKMNLNFYLHYDLESALSILSFFSWQWCLILQISVSLPLFPPLHHVINKSKTNTSILENS